MTNTVTKKNRRSPRRNSAGATLRIGGAVEILAILKKLGADVDEVLALAGIDPELFDDPDNLITYAARDRLLKYCVETTGCQHFGLLVGRRMNLPSLGMVGLLAKTSLNVGLSLYSIVNFLHLHSQGAVMKLRIDDELAILTYDSIETSLEAASQTGDGAVAMMLNVMSSLCGREFRPVEAAFAHHRPANIEPFKKLFKCPLYFDAEHYALVFSRRWLEFRPSDAATEFSELIRKQIRELETKHSLKFPDQVKSLMHSALIAGHCSEDQIAALFSLRAHTLTRRLESFGTNFHDLINEVRFEIASQLLKNTSLSIGEISTFLGYTRASAFIRAFRRWTDTTPGKWRLNQRSPE